jgi:hypothetical protein
LGDLEKKYPWGGDAEKAPSSREECAEVIKQMKMLKDEQKNFKRGNDPRKERAAEMYAVMKNKSEEFRAQPGQRYTKNEVEVEEAEAQLQKSAEDHDALQVGLNKLGNAMLRNVKDLGRLQCALQDHHEATVGAGRDAVDLVNRVMAGEPDEPMDDTGAACSSDVAPPAKKKARRGSAPPARAVGSGSSGASRPIEQERHAKKLRENAKRAAGSMADGAGAGRVLAAAAGVVEGCDATRMRAGEAATTGAAGVAEEPEARVDRSVDDAPVTDAAGGANFPAEPDSPVVSAKAASPVKPIQQTPQSSNVGAAQRRLAAWIHACGEVLADEKLHPTPSRPMVPWCYTRSSDPTATHTVTLAASL